MKTISLRKIVIAVVIIGIATGYARADKQQLQAKLSRDVKIQLTDVTIAQALTKIGETAEVKIVLSDEAVWKLPLGEATRLSVALSGPLADSLTEMLNELFMRYAVGDDEITIYPRQELEHILGRPTTEQIKLLKNLYIDRLEYAEQLRDFNVMVVPIRHYRDLEAMIEEFLVELSLQPTLAQMLDSLGKWYISGTNFPRTLTEIRVVDEEDFLKAKLDQVVDISFKDESADVIIRRLAGWTGMELLVEKKYPSWLEEEIIVDMQNIKLRQALRNIVSTVDGEVNIDFGGGGNYIEIKGPIHPQKPAAPRRTPGGRDAGEGYVGQISIPMDGGKYFIEFMLRQSDLTEELKKLREDKIREILRKVGKTGNNAPEIAARSQPYSILN